MPINARAVSANPGILWHRFASCADDMDLGRRIAELTSEAEEHGHEYLVMRSFYDATEEEERTRRRAAIVRDSDASSHIAAGFKERHLYIPIMAFGMFEGEVFTIFDEGSVAGVRLVFVGPQSRFDTLPYRMSEGVDTSGRICGCAGGF